MKLHCTASADQLKNSDTVALLLSEENAKSMKQCIPSDIDFLIKKADLSFFKGKASETAFIPISNHPNVILCGIGKNISITPDVLREAGGKITTVCRDREIKAFYIFTTQFTSEGVQNPLQPLAEGIYLANYSFNKYKTNNNNNSNHLIEKAVFITAEKQAPNLLKQVEIICRNTQLCRDLVNETSEASNPIQIAGLAKKMSKIPGVTCSVFGLNELKKLKMGLLLAVNKGSSTPPQLVVLKYQGAPKQASWCALVGKGITFDSGGLNLKGSGNIETMRMDMAGAAAVLYGFKAIAELGLKKNIYAILPITENMLSNNSYRPGDVFTAFNGKTIEIGNTDAEGRLILADALAYTVKSLKPDYIIDISTLTGACVATFGEITAAFLSNNDNLVKRLEDSSLTTGEKIWRLPLHSEYEENIKSDIADLNNISADKIAGTIIGATFLKNFIGETPWAHVDIAGTAWYTKPRGCMGKFATGFGLRLLVETVKNWE
jgi:leucyl aminopeptidase